MRRLTTLLPVPWTSCLGTRDRSSRATGFDGHLSPYSPDFSAALLSAGVAVGSHTVGAKCRPSPDMTISVITELSGSSILELDTVSDGCSASSWGEC